MPGQEEPGLMLALSPESAPIRWEVVTGGGERIPGKGGGQVRRVYTAEIEGGGSVTRGTLVGKRVVVDRRLKAPTERIVQRECLHSLDGSAKENDCRIHRRQQPDIPANSYRRRYSRPSPNTSAVRHSQLPFHFDVAAALLHRVRAIMSDLQRLHRRRVQGSVGSNVSKLWTAISLKRADVLIFSRKLHVAKVL